MKKSYLDFQPKNIFWDEDRQRITVIDWNLLSSTETFNPQEDLNVAAQLLDKLVKKDGKEIKPEIKAILEKAMDENPQNSYATAKELRQALEKVLTSLD